MAGPYDRNFEQHLIDNNIFPPHYGYPDGRIPLEAENKKEILQLLARRRASLSPSRFSDEDFRKFQKADANASRERQVTEKVFPIIEGDIGDSKCTDGGIPFTNLKSLTNDKLAHANPDLYYGARPEELDHRIRKQLGGHIVPSTQEDLPILPNYFVEVKGPDGTPAVAKRQLIYGMILGARGCLTAESYGKPAPSFNNHAHTLGCTYQDGLLKMYACHPIPTSAPGAQPGFVTTQLNSWSMTGNPDVFREGAAAYRNGRDWAKQQRNELIKRVNETADNATQTRDQGPDSASEVSTTDIVGPLSQPRNSHEP